MRTKRAGGARARAHIVRVLESSGWRIKGPKGAAAALGLNPATVYSPMKKLGIRPRKQTDDGVTPKQ